MVLPFDMALLVLSSICFIVGGDLDEGFLFLVFGSFGMYHILVLIFDVC